MTYEPPKDIWKVAKELQFYAPLEANDPRYVHTEKGRGAFNFNRILRHLGVDSKDYSLREPKDKSYALFCGHRGCGKSTELKRLVSNLDDKERFFVVFVDATVDLDPNNLECSDILMALAEKLFMKLAEKSIELDNVFLKSLESWFDERIVKHEGTKEFGIEVKAGVEGKTGIPFLASIFGSITNSFKSNSTYKEELRKVIKNGFSQFANDFNQLIDAAEVEINKKNEGRKILFVLDGTDRLTGEDSRRFFIEDSHQLQQIRANFIYCAPISLIYESNQVQQFFDVFRLPMIKVNKKGSDDKFEDGYEVLKEMIYKRADKKLFDSEDTVNKIIEFSGGCPRDLLKIMHYAHLDAEVEKFDGPSVDSAIKQLSIEYKRVINTSDYKILYKIDSSEPDYYEDRVRYFLYNLILLEYNEYWRRSHPVVRLLDGYINIVQYQTQR